MVVLSSLKNNFKKQELFDQAFIHRSYLNEIKDKTKRKNFTSNERLEFLGDSVISFLTSEFLYKKFPKFYEGNLTNLRSSLVKTQTLAKIASSLNLGHYLKLSQGEKQTTGKDNPSLLADAFEALIGALFLDRGIEKVREFLDKTLFMEIAQEVSLETLKDDKSLFQELVQREKKPTPLYRVLKTEGPDHKKIFTVGVFIQEKLWGEGEGGSKQEAEQKAAKVALLGYRK